MSPNLARTFSASALRAVLALAGLTGLAAPAHALNVATWNVIKYPSVNLSARQPNLRTVMAALDPDVIMLQELGTAAGRDSFLINVLNVVQPGQWSATQYFNTCESAVFYKPARVTLTFAGSAIPTGGPRDVLAVRLKLPGYVSNQAEFRLYSVHFKAGTPSTSTPDSTTRRQECTALRINLNNSSLVPNFMIGGDTNFYGDWEGGYIRLTESQADNDGRGKDPLTLPGTWNQNAYRFYHTQSTCSSGCPTVDWATGGLDDRFDLFLSSYSLQDNEGMDIIANVPYGNDGQHYNQSVNGGGFNNAVGLTVATALLNSSDHLPVMVTLQAPAKIVADSRLDFGRILIGGAAQRTLSVAEGAPSPADELTYSLAAPADFTAPAGTFDVSAGAPANTHTISMSTASTGAKGGTLTVACDDPDSAAKPVQLTGTVLRHAVSSLDSLVVTQGDTVDFGNHLIGEFADQNACVYNVGWDNLQALLALTGVVINGGSGRFSIVGGFQSADIAGSARCYSLHFDDQGASPDSAYEAVLVFSGSDEALPGALPASDLNVTLRAQVSATAVGVGRSRPGPLALHGPRPNPFSREVGLSFDLPRESRVSLDLFDPTGRRVAGILDGVRPAGRHELIWSAVDDAGARLVAGLYFVRFRAAGSTLTRRVVLLP